MVAAGVGLYARGADHPEPNLWNYQQLIMAASLLSDGKTFITGGGKVPGECVVWDFPSGQRRLTLNDTGVVYALAASPNGKLLATMGRYVTPHGNRPPDTVPRLGLWDLATGKELALPELQGDLYYGGRGVADMAFSPDSRSLAVANCGHVEIYDVATGKKQASLEGDSSLVRTVAFSADGKLLATGGEDKTIKIWDLARQQVKITLKGHQLPLSALAFSPDGKLLAAGEFAAYGVTGEVTLWDLTTEIVRQRWQIGKGGATQVAFSPDGSRLAFAPATTTTSGSGTSRAEKNGPRSRPR